MRPNALLWSPTIALSWLWGLGFFYSVHVAYTQGWIGFMAFAVPNAVGLAGFGLVLDRFVPQGDLEQAFMKHAAGRLAALMAYQALALGLTMFAFLTCFAGPLLGAYAIPAVLLIGLAAVSCGQSLGLARLKWLHAYALGIGVTAAVVAYSVMPALPGAAAIPRLDGRFYGLLLPVVLGFLLGPWLDVQHWHRACRIRREGGSVGLAYLGGGLLFFCLIALTALFAIGLPADLGLHADLAGVQDATHALAAAFVRVGGMNTAPVLLFGLWAAIAYASTLDSSWAAVRWLLEGTCARSTNPVQAMVPRGLLQTPLWAFIPAAGIAAAAAVWNASVLDLMAPYATLLLGYEACLALQVARRGGEPDAVLCALTGALSATVFAIGYFAGLPLVTTVAPLLALVPVLPQLLSASAPTAAASNPVTPVATLMALPAPVSAAAADTVDAAGWTGGDAGKGYFDGTWFNLAYTPTYDDTNSVGNIYWANYLRWVGKAREMFFARVLPGFDLKTTAFFILTRSVSHDFAGEAREFEPTVVRLRIGKYDRKFATLDHEIRTPDGRTLGRGSQKLMFVDSANYRLVDIPGEVLTAFMPYTVQAKAPAV